MINKQNKNQKRVERHFRVRNKIQGSAARPRLAVYRSLTNIYAQLIDDETKTTIAQASTIDKALIEEKAFEGKDRTEQAKIVGEAIAKRALEKGIKAVVFDRGGYVYTGRVQALADGAREIGLEF